MIQGFELRTSCVLGKYSATELVTSPAFLSALFMTREKWCERQAEADIMWTTLAFEKNEAQLVIITWSRNLGQRVKLGQELSA